MSNLLLDDDVLSALANVHRRRLLVELREQNPHGEVPDASYGTTPPDQLEVEMVHVHLPKLADDGFVEWNRETGTVTRGPRFGDLVPVLNLLAEDGSVLAVGEL